MRETSKWSWGRPKDVVSCGVGSGARAIVGPSISRSSQNGFYKLNDEHSPSAILGRREGQLVFNLRCSEGLPSVGASLGLSVFVPRCGGHFVGAKGSTFVNIFILAFSCLVHPLSYVGASQSMCRLDGPGRKRVYGVGKCSGTRPCNRGALALRTPQSCIERPEIGAWARCSRHSGCRPRLDEVLDVQPRNSKRVYSVEEAVDGVDAVR